MSGSGLYVFVCVFMLVCLSKGLHLPMQETRVRSLGEEVSIPGGGHGNPLQYSHLGISWTEEPGRLQSTGLQKS